MPVTDKELVSNTPFENLKHPNVGISEFFTNRIQQNITQYGDGIWMVSNSYYIFLKTSYNFDT